MAKPTQSGQLYRTVGVMAMLVIGVAIVAPSASEAIIGNAEMSEAQTEAAAAPYKESTPAPAPVAVAPPQPPVQFGAPTMSTEPIDLANYQPQTPTPPQPQPDNPYAGEDNPVSQTVSETSVQANNVVQSSETNNAPPPPEIVSLPRPGPKVGTVTGRRKFADQGRRNSGPSGTARFE